MKRILSILAFSLLSIAVASAQSDGMKLSLNFGLDYDFIFNNKEYDQSNFSPSGTLFFAFLTPSVYLNYGNGDTENRLCAGIDLMKKYGDVTAENKELFREISFYYNYRKMFAGSHFNMTAGIFPRSHIKESWPRVFFSGEYLIQDHNIEGLLLQWENQKSRYELGCDWMGMIGSTPDTREKFLLFSAGHSDITRWLIGGYNMYMLHMACSQNISGVLDNIIMEPYISLNFGRPAPRLPHLNVRMGYINSLQRDRNHSLEFDVLSLGEFCVDAGWSGFGISNSFYAGDDMMPYYTLKDGAGVQYGSNLYFGSSFFRMSNDPSYTGIAYYDRLEFYWGKQLFRGTALKILAIFHFNEGYSGCQQVFRLNVNLDRLRSGINRIKNTTDE